MGRRTKTERIAEQMIDTFRVFFIGIVLIVVAVLAVNALIKDMPIWIQIIIWGLLVAFVYAIRNTVKNFIEDFLKK